MLKINDLIVHYGGIKALQGINLQVEEGSLVTLVGANGAGKSTTLKAIMGLKEPSNGGILFKNNSLLEYRTQEIVSMGITMIPEGRQIFPHLTVEENLRLGAYIIKDKDKNNKKFDQVYSIFPRLKERLKQKGGTLSGGEQQMLAIARGLMSEPKLLLLDEPSLGLAPILVEEVLKVIRQIRDEGVTVLLIEQNAKAALSIADYGYVLETGGIAMEGEGSKLLNDERVKKIYLGAE